MKMARAKDSDITELLEFLRDLETQMSECDNTTLGRWVGDHFPDVKHGYERILFGYTVMFENACDPTKDTLEWKPEISRAMSDENKAVVEAAKDVVAWDWSDNDADCVQDMQKLKDALTKLEG